MTGSAKAWLERAKEDLATVEKLKDDEGLTNIAAFHAQQCVEKCFKAVLEAANKPVPRIHDLVRLAALVAEIDQVQVDETDLIELSTVYLNSRYPVTTGYLPSGKPDLDDIQRFHHIAAGFYRLVASRVTSEE
jgi:HEPN domain-containing protein